MLLFGMFLIPNAHTNITEIDIDFQVGKCNVDTAYSDNARQLANLEKNDPIRKQPSQCAH